MQEWGPSRVRAQARRLLVWAQYRVGLISNGPRGVGLPARRVMNPRTCTSIGVKEHGSQEADLELAKSDRSSFWC